MPCLTRAVTKRKGWLSPKTAGGDLSQWAMWALTLSYVRQCDHPNKGCGGGRARRGVSRRTSLRGFGKRRALPRRVLSAHLHPQASP